MCLGLYLKKVLILFTTLLILNFIIGCESEYGKNLIKANELINQKDYSKSLEILKELEKIKPNVEIESKIETLDAYIKLENAITNNYYSGALEELRFLEQADSGIINEKDLIDKRSQIKKGLSNKESCLSKYGIFVDNSYIKDDLYYLFITFKNRYAKEIPHVSPVTFKLNYFDASNTEEIDTSTFGYKNALETVEDLKPGEEISGLLVFPVNTYSISLSCEFISVIAELPVILEDSLPLPDNLLEEVKYETPTTTNEIKTGVRIGMTQQEVLNSSWGKPESINRTTTSYGTHEQWVYGNNNYLYFDDGILTGIQN